MFSPVGEGSFILRAESAYEYKKARETERKREWETDWDLWSVSSVKDEREAKETEDLSEMKPVCP